MTLLVLVVTLLQLTLQAGNRLLVARHLTNSCIPLNNVTKVTSAVTVLVCMNLYSSR